MSKKKTKSGKKQDKLQEVQDRPGLFRWTGDTSYDAWEITESIASTDIANRDKKREEGRSPEN